MSKTAALSTEDEEPKPMMEVRLGLSLDARTRRFSCEQLKLDLGGTP